MSPKLIAKEVCIHPEDIESKNPDCATRTEYFLSPKLVDKEKTASVSRENISILRPANHLDIAIDPRIPHGKQAFEMRLSGILNTDEVEWVIDGKICGKTTGSIFLWQPERGSHSVYVPYGEITRYRKEQLLS